MFEDAGVGISEVLRMSIIIGHPLRWFRIEAEPPLIDDPYPSEQWSVRVDRDEVYGGVSYHETVEEAVNVLKKEGYLE